MTEEQTIEDQNDTKFDITKIEGEASNEVMALAALLEGNKEFEAQLEEILSSMQENNVDLSKLEGQIILLIEAALKKIALNTKDLEKAHALLDEKKELVSRHLKELSAHLMTKRSAAVQKATSDAEDPKNKNALLTSNVKDHLKIILRKFAIYEIYKIMTPKRIAGQTKIGNFITNAILRGIKVAKRHAGGSIKEMKSYGPNGLKNLNSKSKSFGTSKHSAARVIAHRPSGK